MRLKCELQNSKFAIFGLEAARPNAADGLGVHGSEMHVFRGKRDCWRGEERAGGHAWVPSGNALLEIQQQ